MARLIFEKAIISNVGGTASAAELKGIIADGFTVSEEMLQVAIEDNQNITEGFTSTMTLRSKDLTMNTGALVIDTANALGSHLVYAGGSNILAKRRLKMVGINGGANFYLDNVYVMGRRVFENGREEVELTCQIDSTSTKITKD